MATYSDASHEDELGAAGAEAPRYVPVSHTFLSVTEKISSLVLGRQFHLGWLGSMAVGLGLLGVLTISLAWVLSRGGGGARPLGRSHDFRGLAADPRGGDLGHQHPGGLGFRDHRLRLVDRDRP